MVFGNYALLESMSYGCVPIVTKAQDIEELIQDGVNGFICDFNYESFLLTIEKALEMPSEKYSKMSLNAIATIQKNFSLDRLQKRALELYRQL